MCCTLFFFFNDTATTEIYTLSLHDALPILLGLSEEPLHSKKPVGVFATIGWVGAKRSASPSTPPGVNRSDRKSTRLNSSHANISYAVFCLKKKNQLYEATRHATCPRRTARY